MEKSISRRGGWIGGGLLAATAMLLYPSLAWASSGNGSGPSLGSILPIWSVIPFIGILLSIAIFPLVNGHWWEHNMGKASLFWGLAFFIPFVIGMGVDTGLFNLLQVYVIDYIPFIVLLWGLFTISGGIIIRGTLVGTTYFNALILVIGALLASLIGTTGASVLLIRPLIRANALRKFKAHTIIFFIFIVSNIGGSLTPLGDPPLFLGFLHGVPFFWTLKLLPMFLVNVGVLIGVYILIDKYFCRREQAGTSSKNKIKVTAAADKANGISFGGLYNFIFLAGVIGAVIGSGVLAKHPLFFDAAQNTSRGLALLEANGQTLVMPWSSAARDAFIILMGVLSLKVTPNSLRQENGFTWGPIREVAVLFAGIFATIIPAIAILQARGGELGVTSPAQFFWAAGALSSFLDNTPTYLTFLSLAGGLGQTSGVLTDLGAVSPQILMAISCGSVFMGANTYIGNAPNFMVRSIAEENEIKMPSFFGYMVWSLAILIPLFVFDTLLFFM